MAGRRHVSIREIGTSRKSFNEDRCSGLQRPSSFRAGIFEKMNGLAIFLAFFHIKVSSKKVSVCNGNSGQGIEAKKYEWRKNDRVSYTKRTVPGRDVYKLLYPVIIPFFFTIHIRDFSKR